MSDVRIRPFEDRDREAVLDLRARVFEGLDPERERLRWEWEFDRNPFATSRIPRTWIAELKGRIIGNYGMLPLEFAVDGKRVPGLCGMDFCVDPAHRNLGLGLQLTKAFLDTPGCAVHVVTSPTPTAAKLMRYYGAGILDGEAEPCLWVHAGDAPTGPTLERVEGFDERFDALFERVAAHYRVLIARDQRYLDWRYGTYPFDPSRVTVAPGAAGELGGFSVVQFDEALGRAHLCELFAHPQDEGVLAALASDAVAFVRGQGLGELYVVHRDPAVHRVLERTGFQAVQGHGMSAVCRLPAGLGVTDWYLAAGDGDILFGVGRG